MSLPGEFGGKSFLLASAAIGLSAGMTATLFYSLGSFIPSLQAEFGWSRGDISLAVTLMTLAVRSEEHTSELQSLMRISYAVFCLKKKTENTLELLCHITLLNRHQLQHLYHTQT